MKLLATFVLATFVAGWFTPSDDLCTDTGAGYAMCRTIHDHFVPSTR